MTGICSSSKSTPLLVRPAAVRSGGEMTPATAITDAGATSVRGPNHRSTQSRWVVSPGDPRLARPPCLPQSAAGPDGEPRVRHFPVDAMRGGRPGANSVARRHIPGPRRRSAQRMERHLLECSALRWRLTRIGQGDQRAIEPEALLSHMRTLSALQTKNNKTHIAIHFG